MQYISILRGINVGGKRVILMNDLKVLYASLGLKNVYAYIQSGNVFFDSENPNKEELEALIYEKIKEIYGFDVPVIIRTSSEIEELIKKNPFIEKNKGNISQIALTFLKEKPTKERISQINKLKFPSDKFLISNNNVFVFFEGKYHQTKLSNTFFENTLGISCTTRNWKTVLKLAELSKSK